MGRDYQKASGLRQQVAMLLPIVTGLDGQQKMSKSLGNYIGVKDLPFDKFGKIMSIPDRLMEEYYTYVANFSSDKVQTITDGLKSGKLHPNEVKKDLGQIVVSFFHGDEMGHQMREQFERVFKKKDIPDDLAEFAFTPGTSLVETLVAAKIVESNSEGRRMIAQNAVSFVGADKISSERFVLELQHRGQVIKVGKRKFLKLI